MDMSMGNSGLDLANLISNMTKDGDGFGNGNSWLWFLLILLMWGRNGWGNGTTENATVTSDVVEAAVNKARANELSDQVVLQAVNGNATAISQVMNALNSDYNQVTTVLGQLSTAIQSVGNQVGLTSQQVINSIQLGNQNLIQQLSTCCCNLREQVTAGFGDVKTMISDKSNAAIIQNMQQTTQLQGVMEAGFALMGNRFNDQAAATTAGFQEIKDMFNQSKIDSLQEKVTQLQNAQNNAAQTAAITGYVQAAVTPLQNAVNVLYERSTPAPIPAYVVANPNGVSCGCSTGA